MSWAAYGPQKPSSDGLRWHHASENDIGVICVPAGHNTSGPASEKRPQQDSNLRSRLRRPLLSPLSYGGYAHRKGYQPKSPRGHVPARGVTTGRKTLPSREWRRHWAGCTSSTTMR